jgi:tetraacyldisaccharide 4'-kinase
MTRWDKFREYKVPLHKPIFKSFHIPYIHKIIRRDGAEVCLGRGYRPRDETVKDLDIFAFSGIAKNHEFRRTLGSFKCHISGFLEFPDHHAYSDEDMERILQSAKATNAALLATTEKDYVRIVDKLPIGMDLAIIGIEVSFGDDADLFEGVVKNALM